MRFYYVLAICCCFIQWPLHAELKDTIVQSEAVSGWRWRIHAIEQAAKIY